MSLNVPEHNDYNVRNDVERLVGVINITVSWRDYRQPTGDFKILIY